MCISSLQEVHHQIWINHFLPCTATDLPEWAGVHLHPLVVEINSPLPLPVEAIFPLWGTCPRRPLPLSHLLSHPVLVPTTSPMQVRTFNCKDKVHFVQHCYKFSTKKPFQLISWTDNRFSSHCSKLFRTSDKRNLFWLFIPRESREHSVDNELTIFA